MVLLPLSSIEHDRIDEGENFDNDNDVLTATEKTDPLLTVTLKHVDVEYQIPINSIQIVVLTLPRVY